ncbi:MAG: trypsin-like peptidase domain-containing protein [Planctomycetaceae bacterium]|nr:trypsin-like peptidase domain-containing protein [Planctomycetaceae bacterium]MCA9110698.1 trypsin-like peptidase domain-containing protein [Planctomycetaceae bacterium]
MPSSNSFSVQSRWPLILWGLMAFGNILGPVQMVFAQELPTSTTQTVRVEKPDFTSLSPSLLKEVPESIDDLREIEDRVQALIEKVSECTVALQIGAAQGSGVLVSEDGYVLTAAHVSHPPFASKAGQYISIRLSDGTHAIGRTMGFSRGLDASLIKIEKPEREWPHLKMADLSKLETGAWCVVTGHPGGYQSDRAPVIRLGRVIYADNRVIRTDCELVGGDSGGPLIDLKGEVIGINSRIGEDTSFNLHVPVSVYEKGWDELVASKTFNIHSGAYLGVQGEEVAQGVRLTKIWPDEPAARAGMQTGDILLTFEGVPVESMDDLIEFVGEIEPGSSVIITLLRDGKVIEVEPRLGIREQE